MHSLVKQWLLAQFDFRLRPFLPSASTSLGAVVDAFPQRLRHFTRDRPFSFRMALNRRLDLAQKREQGIFLCSLSVHPLYYDEGETNDE